jgi:hypothetical protein
MGWNHQDVLDILDGIAKPICHYKQPHGMCTGVCLEWLRRLLLKSDWPGIEKGNLEPGDKAGQTEEDKKRREKKKDTRRLGTQNALEGSAKQAFETDLGENPTRHKCVEEYTRLKKRWKEANRDGVKVVVRGDIAAWATKYKMTGLKVGLPPGIKDSDGINSYLEYVDEFAHVYDYNKWLEEEPIVARVLREVSLGAEDARFDPGIALRARFGGMKVVEGANKSRIHTSTTRAAAQQATKSGHFTVGRGMVFGLLEVYKREGHSLGMYRLDDDNYLWLDPNYGVWKMEDLEIHEAMEFLFDKTGEDGEKGVYQEFGGNDPTGFEYTIWEKKAGYSLERKVGSGQ